MTANHFKLLIYCIYLCDNNSLQTRNASCVHLICILISCSPRACMVDPFILSPHFTSQLAIPSPPTYIISTIDSLPRIQLEQST